jgi:hypothetical protein
MWWYELDWAYELCGWSYLYCAEPLLLPVLGLVRDARMNEWRQISEFQYLKSSVGFARHETQRRTGPEFRT